MRETLNRLLAPLKQRILLLIGRGLIQAARQVEGGLPALAAELLRGEARDNLVLMQQFGFASLPVEGGECMVLFPGGDRTLGIVIATDDRRHRPQDLGEGDAALYSAAEGGEEGGQHRVWLRAGDRAVLVLGEEIEIRAEGPLRLASPFYISLETPQVLMGPEGQQVELHGSEGRRVALLDVDCAEVASGSSQGNWPLRRNCGDAQ
jgi:phage gp45-like